jgi:outer membrane protein OmpA-like peptidoglycan-associated protein
MNRLLLVAALAAGAALPAAAQHHGPHHPHGGAHYYAPRYYGHYAYPFSFYFGPRYYSPYYVAPLYSWGPPAVAVPYSIAPPPPPAPDYRERSYAEVKPPEPPRAQPVPPAQPAPPPVAAMERITLSAKELFEFDHATLKKPQPKLDEIAHVMKRHEEIASVRITGYTDRIGTDSYNQKLSERRAKAVKDYLVAQGVEASRLEAVGRGEANPVVECNDADKAALIKCLEPNRRVEVEPITITVPKNPASR